MSLGDQRIPVEVKYRNTIKPEHYKGLYWFVSREINWAPFGILITKNPVESLDERVVAIPLRHFLLLG